MANANATKMRTIDLAGGWFLVNTSRPFLAFGSAYTSIGGKPSQLRAYYNKTREFSGFVQFELSESQIILL